MIFKKAYLRGRQFLRSWQARPLSGPEIEYLQSILTPAQFSLFKALPLYEQRHALNVCRTLTSAGYGYDLDLLQASLLHDLGKFDPATGRAIPIRVKVANVVAGTLAGPLYRAWRDRQSQARPVGGWRYYFWLQAAHEERGAELVQKAGGSARVAALVGQCKRLEQGGDRAAQALSWADDLN